MDVPRVAESYRHSKILITGGTGFIGSALIAKLLRCFPELDTIFIIVRKKRNLGHKKRWDDYKKNARIFGWLRRNRPELLDKVVALEGDVKQRRLGLSDEDYRRLQNEVTIVFHGAASVRFNDPLPDAVLMNTRGTLEMVHLALGMINLKLFVHISTGYSNALQTITDERIYPAPADWKETIRLAEKLDPAQFTILQEKYINGYPNTYTFTKNLAESLIWEFRNKIPIVITRPTVVTTAIKEPFPGYADSLAGPVGLSIAVGKGLIQFVMSTEENNLDYVPIDMVVNVLAVIPWFYANRQSEGKEVINISQPEYALASIEISRMAELFPYRVPFKDCPIFGPSGSNIIFGCIPLSHKAVFRLVAVFFHLLPPAVYDITQKLLKGKSENILRIAIKLNDALYKIQYFVSHTFHFPNHNLNYILKSIPPEDQDEFVLFYKDVNMRDYLEPALVSCGRDLAQFDHDEKYRFQVTRRLWTGKVIKTIFISMVLKLVYQSAAEILPLYFCS